MSRKHQESTEAMHAIKATSVGPIEVHLNGEPLDQLRSSLYYAAKTMGVRVRIRNPAPGILHVDRPKDN